MSAARAAKFPAPAQTYFRDSCSSVRSALHDLPLGSRSAPTVLPLRSVPHRPAPAPVNFYQTSSPRRSRSFNFLPAPLRSVFRSNPAPLTCSDYKHSVTLKSINFYNMPQSLSAGPQLITIIRSTHTRLE